MNENKAIAKIDAHHNVASHFVSRCGELSEHITDRLAFTVSSVATISVAITSVVPEGMAVAAASGNAWLGIAAASASVAGVFVAMQKPIVWWIYAAQLLLSLSLVRVHDGGPLILYPLVSCCGALIAAHGVGAVEAKVKESKAESRADLDADLDREIKMMRAKQSLENSKARTAAKYSVKQPPKPREMSDRRGAVSPATGAVGAPVEDMLAVRTSKMTARQQEILAAMDGQKTSEFVKSMAQKFDKDPRTIRRDLRDLKEGKLAKINGTVKRK